MITFYDLIAIILPLVGIMFGVMFIKDFGIWWGIIIMIAGGLIGRWLGRLPTRLLIRNERRKMAHLTVDELRQHLYKPLFSGGYTSNFLLLELRARGEDITEHIDLILNMLKDKSNLCRTLGYTALLSAYPHLANKMSGYNPSMPVEDCKTKVTELRKIAKQITSGDASERVKD